MNRTDLKNVAVQTDLKCKHCTYDITGAGYRADASIQTEWNAIDNGGSFHFLEKNINVDDTAINGCVVAPTQGIVVPNGNDLRLLTDPCNSHPFDSCLNCKYVNNCADDNNLQRRQCPSLPEPACISVNSCDSLRCEFNNIKEGHKKKGDMPWSKRKNVNSRLGDLGYCFMKSIRNSKEKDIDYAELDGNDDYEPLPESSREDLDLESLSLNEEVIKKKRFLKRKIPSKIKTTFAKKRLIQKSNYVSAGLYSDYFKSDLENSLANQKGPCKVFPWPIHYGRYLLAVKEDFLLPRDVWISRNIMKAQHPSLVYKKIKNNIYIDARPVCKDSEASQCNCTPPSNPLEQGCIDNCLNRMVYTECVPNVCACGDRCGNQRIQKHQAFTSLKEFLTKDRGYGVQAIKPLSAGQFIMEYVGEVVSEQEFRRRMTDLYSGMEHHYCLSLDGGTVIDGYRCGNISRLINHSCSPNCEMQKWNVNGVPRIGLFAMKDIGIREELTYDYNFHAYNINSQQECKCGSDNCRKVVGGRGQKETQSLEKPKGKKVGFIMFYNKGTRSQILQKFCSDSGYLGIPSARERKLISRKMLLLMRNLNRARKAAGLLEELVEKDPKEEDPAKNAEVFKTQFTAINTSRSVRTRQLTKAEDNDAILRMSFLAQVFMQVFNDVSNCKDEFGNVSPKSPYHLPSKRKSSMLVPGPVDLSTISRNISSGKYSSCISFHNDFMKFFSGIEKISQSGTSLELMKSQYFISMENARSFLESIGDDLPSDLKSFPSSPPPPPSPQTSVISNVSTVASSPISLSSASYYQPLMSPISDLGAQGNVAFKFKEDADDSKIDDVIRCVCGLCLDEGVMLQCENCQHQICMKADKDEEDYLCHLCGTRKVSKEIPLMNQPRDKEGDYLYYMTMMRGDLQLRVGEVVYVIDEEDLFNFLLSTSSKIFKTLEEFNEVQLAEAYERLSKDVEKLDLYKIENLWVDEKGCRLMHGHYYLKPREIYHDAGQKFYEKEVLKAPSLASTFPVICAVAPCCVMDVCSYATGRPIGFAERDVYVCEFRVDKNRRTIKKPLKFIYPPNKSSFCFNRFARKDNFKRTYVPHDVTHLKVKQNFHTGKSRKRANENQIGSIKVNDAGGGLVNPKKEQKLESKQKNLEDIISKITGEISMAEHEKLV